MELATLLAHAHERLNALGAADHDMQVERMLKGIGFVEQDMHRLMSELSGGWRMRAELARSAPDAARPAAAGRAHEPPGPSRHPVVGGPAAHLPRCAWC